MFSNTLEKAGAEGVQYQFAGRKAFAAVSDSLIYGYIQTLK